MNLNDPIGDMITRIRNAQSRAKPKVSTPGSKLRKSVLEVLKSEGYIRDYSTLERSDGRTVAFQVPIRFWKSASASRGGRAGGASAAVRAAVRTRVTVRGRMED